MFNYSESIGYHEGKEKGEMTVCLCVRSQQRKKKDIRRNDYLAFPRNDIRRKGKIFRYPRRCNGERIPLQGRLIPHRSEELYRKEERKGVQ